MSKIKSSIVEALLAVRINIIKGNDILTNVKDASIRKAFAGHNATVDNLVSVTDRNGVFVVSYVSDKSEVVTDTIDTREYGRVLNENLSMLTANGVIVTSGLNETIYEIASRLLIDSVESDVVSRDTVSKGLNVILSSLYDVKGEDWSILHNETVDRIMTSLNDIEEAIVSVEEEHEIEREIEQIEMETVKEELNSIDDIFKTSEDNFDIDVVKDKAKVDIVLISGYTLELRPTTKRLTKDGECVISDHLDHNKKAGVRERVTTDAMQDFITTLSFI